MFAKTETYFGCFLPIYSKTFSIEFLNSVCCLTEIQDLSNPSVFLSLKPGNGILHVVLLSAQSGLLCSPIKIQQNFLSASLILIGSAFPLPEKSSSSTWSNRQNGNYRPVGQTSAHAIDMWLCGCTFLLWTSTALHFNNIQKVTLLLHLHEVFAGLRADNALPEALLYVQANTMLLATVILVLCLHPHSS